MSIANRISIIMHSHKLTNAGLADLIGVQRSSVSHVLSGRNKPSLDFLEKIVVHFPKVNSYWLLTGKMRDDSQVSDESSREGLTDLLQSNELQGVNKEKVLKKVVLIFADGTFEELRKA